MAVGPLVSLAQAQGEYPVFDNLVTLEQIRLEFQVVRVAEQARITVDDDLADILLLAHQQPHLTAIFARFLIETQLDGLWLLRNPLSQRRQLASLDQRLQHWRLDQYLR